MNKELQIVEGPDGTVILSALRNLPGSTDGLQAEIRTWDLPNAKQGGY